MARALWSCFFANKYKPLSQKQSLIKERTLTIKMWSGAQGFVKRCEFEIMKCYHYLLYSPFWYTRNEQFFGEVRIKIDLQRPRKAEVIPFIYDLYEFYVLLRETIQVCSISTAALNNYFSKEQIPQRVYGSIYPKLFKLLSVILRYSKRNSLLIGEIVLV